ncbi:indole-3-glycerol phosphate synthase TrpC [Hespellia stercorisuis]|uniref:Indole-3-glycerol phosphate synthase n=1 Tax=Hespellia stercorisuis DSM 15480 TaxID=1121950 RepID=A0A1M6IHP1_9FIRM|nr:indole-3-glycerol phosphate synthase TrpC [Hespellia stercorisuis]SHJ33934.1 indole-3-glycerol phosphate synthase [Hespellia stercorisuis DSM 15480]
MILDELAEYAKKRVAAAKNTVSAEIIKERALALPKGEFCFEHTLKKAEMSFICEVKKASPSKGIIAENFPYVEIAKDYEAAGADCVSVLTEPKWFQGSDEIFCEIRKKIKLPMIRKDFTVDAYQIYEAKVMGADAVLLICALLDTETIRSCIQICDELGITALVETHNEEEIDSAVAAGARVIGVNNRNLKNFTVDFSNAARLRDRIPENVVFVAESGVKNAEDIRQLAKVGADAVLVGEALMKSEDKAGMLREFRSRAEHRR